MAWLELLRRRPENSARSIALARASARRLLSLDSEEIDRLRTSRSNLLQWTVGDPAAVEHAESLVGLLDDALGLIHRPAAQRSI